MTAWVLMVLGLVALITGAELLVRGGSRLAARLGIPPIVVGVTVVSLGTSTPELAIGVQSALQDDGTLALGNIAGTHPAASPTTTTSSLTLSPIWPARSR